MQRLVWNTPEHSALARDGRIGDTVDTYNWVIENCKGTSRPELRECAKAAADAGGTALCEYYGAPGPVAELCGSLAAEIAGPVYDLMADAWEGLFGDSEAEEEHKRKVEELAVEQANLAHVQELDVLLYTRADDVGRDLTSLSYAAYRQALIKAMGKAVAFDDDFNLYDARFLLAQNGLRTYDRGCGSGNFDTAIAHRDACLGTPPLPSLFQGHHWAYASVVKLAQDWLAELEAAKALASTMIVANAAAFASAVKSGRIVLTPSGEMAPSSSVSKKKSSAAPLVIGAIGLGALAAWWKWG